MDYSWVCGRKVTDVKGPCPNNIKRGLGQRSRNELCVADDSCDGRRWMILGLACGRTIGDRWLKMLVMVDWYKLNVDLMCLSKSRLHMNPT